MKGPNSNQEMYNIIPRLFGLVNELTEDQQVTLLRQLIKGDTKRQLFKAIIDMSEPEQLELLKRIENTPALDLPVKTVSLDDAETSMRSHQRKRCLIHVSYTVAGNVYRDYILDISNLGLFIETEELFTVGMDISLTFKLPNYNQPLKLDASIAWIGHKGIGVKFKSLSSYQKEIIQSFLENESNS
jgi:Tfp pilus assembly protein PilZ